MLKNNGLTGEPGITIWLVKSLIVDIFETNIWQVFVKCGWQPNGPAQHNSYNPWQ